MKTISFILLLLVFVFSTSCAQKQKRVSCQDVTVSFSYYDSDTFDNKLSETLHCSENLVTLEMPSILSTSDIPDRLDNWLCAVDDSGGKIFIEEDPEAPVIRGSFSVGIILDAIELAKASYDYIQEKQLYESTKDYDVYVYYRGGIGNITRVVFKKKNL